MDYLGNSRTIPGLLITAVRILILLILVVTPDVSDAQAKDPPPNYNDYNQYAGGNNDYQYPGGNDYNQDSYYIPDEPSHQCFVCSYEVYSDNTEQGFRECRDPFDEHTISKIDCPYPCSKTYEKHGEKEYEIRRACMPSCKEEYRVNYYRQCCDEHLCNGASGILPILKSAPVTLVTVSALLTSYLAWLLRR